jgi:small subunit ribosomal protein S15
MVSAEEKKELVEKFGGEAKNTGKPEVQIAILTSRIKDLTAHVGVHKKDNHTRRGLIALVSKRRKLLSYLQNRHIERYRTVIADLELRK